MVLIIQGPTPFYNTCITSFSGHTCRSFASKFNFVNTNDVLCQAIFNIYSGFYVVAFPQMMDTPTGYDTYSRRYGSKTAA